MFIVVGEFLISCLIVMGSILLRKSHPKIAEGMFLTYVAFMLLNYFAVRWQHEWLKRKVMKFKKMRKKVSNFDFGLPNPPGISSSSASSQVTTPKKTK